MERPPLSMTTTDPTMKGHQGAPTLLSCLGGHQVFKSMHLTKFLGFNLWTLPFPIPAGGQGPTGLQSVGSRAGSVGQTKGCGVSAGEITRQDKSLGLPAGTRLPGKTVWV